MEIHAQRPGSYCSKYYQALFSRSLINYIIFKIILNPHGKNPTSNYMDLKQGLLSPLKQLSFFLKTEKSIHVCECECECVCLEFKPAYVSNCQEFMTNIQIVRFLSRPHNFETSRLWKFVF